MTKRAKWEKEESKRSIKLCTGHRFAFLVSLRIQGTLQFESFQSFCTSNITHRHTLKSTCSIQMCAHLQSTQQQTHAPAVVTVIVYTFLSRNLLFCILFYRLLHVNAWLNDRWILVQEEEEEENGNDELSISMIQSVSVSVSWRVISSQYTFCQQMISNFFENTEKTILYTSTLNARDTIT